MKSETIFPSKSYAMVLYTIFTNNFWSKENCMRNYSTTEGVYKNLQA